MGDESNMSSDEMMKICSSISFTDVWNIYLHDLILSAKFSHSTPTQVVFFSVSFDFVQNQNRR